MVPISFLDLDVNSLAKITVKRTNKNGDIVQYTYDKPKTDKRDIFYKAKEPEVLLLNEVVFQNPYDINFDFFRLETLINDE